MSERRDYAAFAARTTPRPSPCAEVRVAALDDVEPAVALAVTVSTAGAQGWRERLQRDVEQPDRALLVARVDDLLVGYARTGHVVPGPEDTAPEGWYLTGLVVAAQWRRQGVGEALVLAACAHVAMRADVLWSTYDEENLASAHLHAALGFRVVWRGDVGFPAQPLGSRWVLVQRLLAQ